MCECSCCKLYSPAATQSDGAFEQKEQEMIKWLDEFIAAQRQLDPDTQKVLDDNLYELYEK